MASQSIRAVYENGLLRPLDPISLMDGQHIQLMILSEQEQTRAALADLVVQFDAQPLEDIDEAVLQAEIDASITGNPAVSDAIIEERREGP